VRAIIIDDKDARGLLDQLKLDHFKQIAEGLPQDLPPETWKKAVLDEIHRKFHLVVCRWLQDQGASPIR